jgi:hypothetical protein
MATTEERMRILKMIQDKQITAAEGARLIETLRASESEVPTGEHLAKARWLRLRVTDTGTGKQKLSVNIPIGLLDVGLKMGARFAPDVEGLDFDAVRAAIKEGMQGKIMEIEDEKDNERVEIFAE